MKRMHFDGVADNTAIAAGTTPTTLGDAGSATYTGSPSVFVKTAAKIRGARGLNVLVTTATDIATIALSDTSATSGRASVMFEVNSAKYPVAASAVILRVRSTSANAAIGVLTTAGVLILQNAAGTGLKNFNSNTALPNGWYVLCIAAIKGTGTGDGTISAWLRKASDDSLVDSYGPVATVNAGTANITTAQTGKPIGSGTVDLNFDEFQFETGSTTEIPRIPANTAPTANAGPDQTKLPGTLCTLDGTGSTDPEFDTLTYAWTPPGGITLSSNTASQPTFTTPYAMTQQTYTFGLVVTDTGALSSSSDTVVITVPAHPEWYHNGTAWKPEIISSL